MPDIGFWKTFYLSTEPLPWDLGQASPALCQLFQEHPPKPTAHILVPGCGVGHDAVYLASIGYDVTAVDFIKDALDAARELARSVGVQVDLLEENVLTLPKKLAESFDVIAEHTCYASLHPKERDDYVKEMRRVLRPGGLVMGVFFDVEAFPDRVDQLSRPPYPSTEAEVTERFRKHGFLPRHVASAGDRAEDKPFKQIVAIFQKKLT